METISDKELKIASYFVNTRIFWHRLAIFLLFFADVVLIYSVSLKFLFYWGGAMAHDKLIRELQNDYVNLTAIHSTYQGSPLRVSEVKKISAGVDQIDIITEVINPNTRLFAKEVEYRLVQDGIPQEVERTFVLAGQRKSLFAFGVQGSVNSDIQLEIVNTRWQRIGDNNIRHKILSNMEVGDLKWGNSGGDFEISGAISNGSGRGFWNIGLLAIIRSGPEIVGVNYTTLFKVEPNEVREFVINWPYDISRVTSVTVLPDVNVYDDSIFMPLFTRIIDPSGIDQ